MATLGDDLRHIVEAGIGAVATGVEEAGKVMDTFAQKGAPILNEMTRKAGVAADKVQQAFRESELFRESPAVTDILDDCRKLSFEELDDLMDDLALLYAQKRDELEAPAPEASFEKAPAEEPAPVVAEPIFDPSSFFVDVPDASAQADELQRKLDELTRQLNELRKQMK